MVDRLHFPHSSSSPPLPLREKVGEDEGEVRLLINPSAGPERESERWGSEEVEV